VDPSYFSTAFDRAAIRSAIRAAHSFLSGPAWEGYVLGPSGALAGLDLNDDEKLDEFVRQGASGANHAVGTCKMAKEGGKEGVVDSKLKVRGVKGLRVVDASVLVSVV
jgi:choline dehydrogenase-like flavoprotein